MVEAWAVVESGIVTESHDADRIVPWWSFTKTVLAAGALALVRDGAASLDATMPGQPYTLRHLLQHRSGLTDYGGLAAYHEAVARNDEPWTVETLLARTEADRLRYRAGEGWDYSNIGYLFVRQLIESRTGEDLDTALRRLVLKPLGIQNARIAATCENLEAVAMGEVRNYHPGWVYHGLLIGPVAEAALLLDRLLGQTLLPANLMKEVLTAFRLGGPVPGRPWAAPGYGLGVMTGETSLGSGVVGHTGGGPGSTIAVYRALEGQTLRTAACFETDVREARTEEKTFRLLGG